MANNNDSSDNKAKKSSSCGHLMPGFDNHRYCFKCREAGKGDDLCALKKDCLLCASFSEDQKRKLASKHSKGKKSVKETTVEKPKIDDSILDEDDNSSVTNVAQSSTSNNQALAAILSQLTSISNRLSAVEKKDSPMQADIVEASPRGSSDCREKTISSENTSVEVQSKRSAEENPSCDNRHKKGAESRFQMGNMIHPKRKNKKKFQFYCVNTSYPMDNLVGRQTSEKDVLCFHRLGRSSTVHLPDGVSYFLPV